MSRPVQIARDNKKAEPGKGRKRLMEKSCDRVIRHERIVLSSSLVQAHFSRYRLLTPRHRKPNTVMTKVVSPKMKTVVADNEGLSVLFTFYFVWGQLFLSSINKVIHQTSDTIVRRFHRSRLFKHTLHRHNLIFIKFCKRNVRPLSQ